MRITLLLPTLIFAISLTANPQGKHWTETSDETIWRERYGNCDHGYFVNLPSGVIGHSTHAPSPNHGILISVNDPGKTTQVTFEEPRLIGVYDSNDAGELGSPRAYIQHNVLKPANASEAFKILERRDTKFRGSAAEYIHFRKTTERSTSEVEELVVYRTSKEIGASFYVVMLQTAPEFYSRDHSLFLQIREGVRFVSVPLGECSND
jgi:hypothetical protein